MAELVHAVPLADLPVVEESAVTIEVLPARGMIALRGPMEDGRFIEAVRGAVGFEPPDRRRFRFEGGRGVFWMSPDELLLMTPREEVAGCIKALGVALEGVHHLVVDMSDARAGVPADRPRHPRGAGQGCSGGSGQSGIPARHVAADAHRIRRDRPLPDLGDPGDLRASLLPFLCPPCAWLSLPLRAGRHAAGRVRRAVGLFPVKIHRPNPAGRSCLARDSARNLIGGLPPMLAEPDVSSIFGIEGSLALP